MDCHLSDFRYENENQPSLLYEGLRFRVKGFGPVYVIN